VALLSILILISFPAWEDGACKRLSVSCRVSMASHRQKKTTVAIAPPKRPNKTMIVVSFPGLRITVITAIEIDMSAKAMRIRGAFLILGD